MRRVVSTATHPAASDGSCVQEQTRLISLARIRKSRFQNRVKIDEGHVAALAYSIRAERLNNPVLVRPMGDGSFELLAGEHRYEALKLNGAKEALAIVTVLDDKEAARLAVFDNLYHLHPTDYELYKGFGGLLEIGAVPSIRALARRASLSHTQINRILSFGRLPQAACAMLEAEPGLIGAAVAEPLARYATEGHGELVVRVLEKIRAGQLTQLRAVSWMQRQLTNGGPPRTARVLTDAEGRRFCSIAREGASIRIRVAASVDAAALEQAVYRLLQCSAEAATAKRIHR